MIFYVSVPIDKLEERIGFFSREVFYPEVRMAKVDHLLSLSKDDLARMRGLLEKESLAVFTHGPFFGLDIASLDRNISRYTAECLEIGIEVTAALGAEVMVIHTGFIPFFSRGGRRHWFRNWSRMMPQVVEKAQEFGVTIALENTWEDRPEVLDYLASLLPS
ncbi:MAG: TIM barrel protein, partial [Candidatus Krumholzibacteria bacterium]|nr:TIM barrel protein [Candidatus Krumholzibacteria bacterium]